MTSLCEPGLCWVDHIKGLLSENQYLLMVALGYAMARCVHHRDDFSVTSYDAPTSELWELRCMRARILASVTLEIARQERLEDKRQRPSTDMPQSRDQAAAGTPDVRRLIERAIYDLERGWNAAALDALGRAVALLEDAP